MGGYDMLNGGNILVGFQALTGDPVFHLGREGNVFQRYDLKYFQPDKSKTVRHAISGLIVPFRHFTLFLLAWHGIKLT
jgi:hypothetical protein